MEDELIVELSKNRYRSKSEVSVIQSITWLQL